MVGGGRGGACVGVSVSLFQIDNLCILIHLATSKIVTIVMTHISMYNPKTKLEVKTL